MTEERVPLSHTMADHEANSPTPARALPVWVDALYGANKPIGVVDELLAERAVAGRAEYRGWPGMQS